MGTLTPVPGKTGSAPVGGVPPQSVAAGAGAANPLTYIDTKPGGLLPSAIQRYCANSSVYKSGFTAGEFTSVEMKLLDKNGATVPADEIVYSRGQTKGTPPKDFVQIKVQLTLKDKNGREHVIQTHVDTNIDPKDPNVGTKVKLAYHLIKTDLIKSLNAEEVAGSSGQYNISDLSTRTLAVAAKTLSISAKSTTGTREDEKSRKYSTDLTFDSVPYKISALVTQEGGLTGHQKLGYFSKLDKAVSPSLNDPQWEYKDDFEGPANLAEGFIDADPGKSDNTSNTLAALNAMPNAIGSQTYKLELLAVEMKKAEEARDKLLKSQNEFERTQQELEFYANQYDDSAPPLDISRVQGKLTAVAAATGNVPESVEQTTLDKFNELKKARDDAFEECAEAYANARKFTGAAELIGEAIKEKQTELKKMHDDLCKIYNEVQAKYDADATMNGKLQALKSKLPDIATPPPPPPAATPAAQPASPSQPAAVPAQPASPAGGPPLAAAQPAAAATQPQPVAQPAPLQQTPAATPAADLPPDVPGGVRPTAEPLTPGQPGDPSAAPS